LTLNEEQKKRDLETVEEIKETIIQTVAENMHLYGINDSVGRLYGTLYFSNSPLNLDDMREALGMSKTSMSTGVRSLLETKMVRKVWKKGVRKDLYQAEENWYQTFFDYFSTKWIDAIEDNLHTIQKAERKYLYLLDKEDIDPNVKEYVHQDLKKIKQIKEYYDWLKRLIHTFETGQIFQFVPKENK